MKKINMVSVLVTLFLLFSIPAGIYLVQQKTHFFNEALGTPAHLYIDASSVQNSTSSEWRNLAQGGEEKGRMLASVIPQIANLQPEYIRIDHLYDLYDVVQKDSAGNINFNWGNLDQTVSDIIASGATPFLSLSYMPPAISLDGNTTSLPKNWADWELVVQRTIEHYSGRSEMNLKNVYYEVWNEPDLFGGFKIDGQKNYIDLYSHAALGASRASNVNSFKFGGPATTDLYQSWFDGMFKMAASGVRMDFFSWHKYSKDIGDYDNEISNVKQWIANYPNLSGIELIISETGINGANDPAYDGYLSAVQTLATMSVIGGTVSKGFSFEIKDGPGDKQYWGRWGLLTNDKFGAPQIKPRYNAILFLNSMKGNLVNVVGQGSWIKAFARQDGQTLKLFVVNYDPYGNHSELVPIRIDKLKNGNYTEKRINYGGAVTTKTVSVTGSVLDLSEAFTANTAAIFEIIPQ